MSKFRWSSVPTDKLPKSELFRLGYLYRTESKHLATDKVREEVLKVIRRAGLQDEFVAYIAARRLGISGDE